MKKLMTSTLKTISLKKIVLMFCRESACQRLIPKKIKNECGTWDWLLHNSVAKMSAILKKMNLVQKSLMHLNFVRCKIHLESLSRADIASLKFTIKEQTQLIPFVEEEIEKGNYQMLTLPFEENTPESMLFDEDMSDTKTASNDEKMHHIMSKQQKTSLS